MKKLAISGCLIALVLFLAAAESYGQRPAGQRRNQQRQRNIDRVLGVPRANRPAGRPPRLTPQQRRMIQQRLMREIGLTENQRLRMAEIQRSHEDERISAGRRVRQARQALDRAIRSEQLDQGEIDRLIEELATAQADQVRVQARIRAQMRGVLTSDQMLRLNELERRLRRQMRQQQEREMREDGTGDRNAPDPDKPADEEPLDLLGLLVAER